MLESPRRASAMVEHVGVENLPSYFAARNARSPRQCIPVAGGVRSPTLGLSLSPVLASAAMTLSSVSVVMNSLRLRRVPLDS